MNERRRHARIAFSAYVKLIDPATGERKVELRDMSDGGAFLLVPDHDNLPIGTVVQIQALDIEDAPVVSARVARHDPAGIGLMFIEE